VGKGSAALIQPACMRLALVVHPTRPVTETLETLERWAKENELDVVQITTDGGSDRELAPSGELEAGDLVVTLGGDGTVLSALRAAAPLGLPVLGVACGSLGALTAVRADRLEEALGRFRADDWKERKLPALAINPEGSPDAWAVNDFVVIRRGAGQVVLSLSPPARRPASRSTRASPASRSSWTATPRSWRTSSSGSESKRTASRSSPSTTTSTCSPDYASAG